MARFLIISSHTSISIFNTSRLPLKLQYFTLITLVNTLPLWSCFNFSIRHSSTLNECDNYRFFLFSSPLIFQTKTTENIETKLWQKLSENICIRCGRSWMLSRNTFTNSQLSFFTNIYGNIIEISYWKLSSSIIYSQCYWKYFRMNTSSYISRARSLSLPLSLTKTWLLWMLTISESNHLFCFDLCLFANDNFLNCFVLNLLFSWWASRRKVGNKLRSSRIKLNHNMVTGQEFSWEKMQDFLLKTFLYIALDSLTRFIKNRVVSTFLLSNMWCHLFVCFVLLCFVFCFCFCFCLFVCLFVWLVGWSFAVCEESFLCWMDAS
jgi:hypothetical protein